MVRKMKVIFKKGYWVLILEHHHEVRIERHYRENQVYKGLENIGVNPEDITAFAGTVGPGQYHLS